MINNLTITQNVSLKQTSKHKRYSLVATSIYGKEYIPNNKDIFLEEDARKYGRLYLAQIDAITAKSTKAEELLIEKGIYDYKAPATLSIEYQSQGITKSLPVMYNDELLAKIASLSNTQVVQNNDTAMVFQNIKNKLLENEDNLLNRLLHCTPEITDPKIIAVLNKMEERQTSEINFEQLYNMIHKYYKQWRAFYYHTSTHYQKDIAIKQKKL